MEKIEFLNEHIAIGNFGKLSVYIALVSALFSFICYAYFTYNPKERTWLKAARIALIVNCVAIFSIFAILFVIIQKHYFEYQYAYQHSSLDLPLKYMISCFWEGQEGSFLLWMIWHAVLSLILLKTAKSFEGPVLAILMLAQLMLSSMLLGIDVLGYVVGNNPFELLRVKSEGPIFNRANYLSFIKDGNGLNPLLQNYWMVIHPPTLFLGFAASIVPFAFAVAGLWQRRFSDWIKPALPWTIFAVMILGTGIIMGAFWAYESLSFGGYWAWDPVENASLFPWILQIALLHVMLIYKNSGKALIVTFFLSLFSFILVLYATFLTRSGILGNTSVHAFTDLGMSGQLIVFILVFFFFAVYLSAHNKKSKNISLISTLGFVVLLSVLHYFQMDSKYTTWTIIAYVVYLFVALMIHIEKNLGNKQRSEFNVWSREFWLLIGSILLSLSVFQILILTSFPVINKIFGTSMAQPEDVIEGYHQFQLPFAFIILILTGFGQFFKYKTNNKTKLLYEMLKTTLLALIFTSLGLFYFEIFTVKYIFFMFACFYAIIGNIQYLVKIKTSKISAWGSSVAHVGFGVLLLGALISSAKKEVISINNTNVTYGDGFDEQNTRENVLLWKNIPIYINEYEVTYLGDTVDGINNYYKVNYKKIDFKTGKASEEFDLYPNAQINPKMGLVSNPDTRHYITHDIFTHVSSVPDKEAAEQEEYHLEGKFFVNVGDTIKTHNANILVGNPDNLDPSSNKEYQDFRAIVSIELKVMAFADTVVLNPIYGIKDNQTFAIDAKNDLLGVQATLTNIIPDKENPEKTMFEIMVHEKPPFRDYVILKAIKFPFINLVWGGTLLMVAGFIISMVHRIQDSKKKKKSSKVLPSDDL